MIKLIKLVAVVATLVLTGCAHQIQINPNMNNFSESEQKADQIVGYYISDVDRSKKVTTPGGGGDKVSYTPYKDTETVLFNVLSNHFKDVYKMSAIDDTAFIKTNHISLIFIPTITTNSSSSSFVTWPPTNFTYNLHLKALSDSGETLWEDTISAEGVAEYDEFKSDFSLSARRATEKVFKELAEKLEAKNFNASSTLGSGE